MIKIPVCFVIFPKYDAISHKVNLLFQCNPASQMALDFLISGIITWKTRFHRCRKIYSIRSYGWPALTRVLVNSIFQKKIALFWKEKGKKPVVSRFEVARSMRLVCFTTEPLRVSAISGPPAGAFTVLLLWFAPMFYWQQHTASQA